MPVAIRVFLAYALAILALIGLSLRFVVAPEDPHQAQPQGGNLMTGHA